MASRDPNPKLCTAFAAAAHEATGEGGAGWRTAIIDGVRWQAGVRKIPDDIRIEKHLGVAFYQAILRVDTMAAERLKPSRSKDDCLRELLFTQSFSIDAIFRPGAAFAEEFWLLDVTYSAPVESRYVESIESVVAQGRWLVAIWTINDERPWWPMKKEGTS